MHIRITKKFKGGIVVFGAINRMEGSSVDWSQLSGVQKHSNAEAQRTGSSAQSTTQKQEADQMLSQSDKEKLYKEVEKVNEQLKANNHAMRFKFSEEAEQFYVEVFDSKSQEVIETIPAKHMIDLAAKLKDMIGFFIDKKL